MRWVSNKRFQPMAQAVLYEARRTAAADAQMR